MWVEFDAILMPHRELLLGRGAGNAPCGRIPCPDLEFIQRVQSALEIAAGKGHDVALEVSVDVVRPGFGFGERSVEEDLGDADLPQLPDQDLGVGDQFGSMGSISLELGGIRGSGDEDRGAHLVEGRVISPHFQHSIYGEVPGERRHQSVNIVNLTYLSSRVLSVALGLI